MTRAVVDHSSKIDRGEKNWRSGYAFAALLLLGGLMETAKKDSIAVDGVEVDSSSSRCGDGVEEGFLCVASKAGAGVDAALSVAKAKRHGESSC